MFDHRWMSPADVQNVFRGQDLPPRRSGQAHPTQLARWAENAHRPAARARRSR